MASMSSTATSRNESAIGSMSDRRTSTSSNASSMSGMSDLSSSSRTSLSRAQSYTMDNEHDQTTEAMMDDGEDSGIASIDSGSRRDSLSSIASMASNVSGSRRDSSSSMASNDSGIGSLSDRRSSTSSNASSMSGLIHIQVVDYKGKTQIASVRPTDTVKDLKVKIQEKLRIAPSQQRLQFQGKILDDKSTSSVKCLGLQNLSTVHLQGRLQGGALFSTA